MILFSTLSQGNTLLLFTYLGFLSGCVFFLFLKLSLFISTRKLYSSTPNAKKDKTPSKKEKKEKPVKEKSYLDALIEKQKEEKRQRRKQLKLEEKNRKLEIRLALKNAKKHKHVSKDKSVKEKNKDKKLSEKALLNRRKREEKKQKKLLIREMRKEKLLAIRQKQIKRLKKVLFVIFRWFRNSLSTIISVTAFASVLIFSMLCNIKLNYGRINLISIIVFITAFTLSKIFLKILANLILSVYNKLKGKVNDE